MLFNAFYLIFVSAFYGINIGTLYERTLLLSKELHALRRTVRALVVLSGKVCYCKYVIAFGKSYVFKIYVIYRRLGKYARNGRLEFLFGNAVHIVAQKLADVFDGYFKKITNIVFSLLCL